MREEQWRLQEGRQTLLHAQTLGAGTPTRRRLADVFNLSGTELVFIAILGLVVLGPEKLPSAMRRAGKIYREIRSISGNVQREVQKVMDEPMRQMKSLVEEPASETKKVAKQVNDIFAGKMPHLAQPRKDATVAPADPNDGSGQLPDEPAVDHSTPTPPPPDTEARS